MGHKLGVRDLMWRYERSRSDVLAMIQRGRIPQGQRDEDGEMWWDKDELDAFDKERKELLRSGRTPPDSAGLKR